MKLFKSAHSRQHQEQICLRTCRRLVRQDRYTAALRTLQTTLSRIPSSILYDYEGALLSLMGKTQEALKSFSRALQATEQAEERAAIYFHRGLLYGRKQHFDQALLDLSRATLLAPSEFLYQEAREQITNERVAHLGEQEMYQIVSQGEPAHMAKITRDYTLVLTIHIRSEEDEHEKNHDWLLKELQSMFPDNQKQEEGYKIEAQVTSRQLNRSY